MKLGVPVGGGNVIEVFDLTREGDVELSEGPGVWKARWLMQSSVYTRSFILSEIQLILIYTEGKPI